MVGYFYYQNPGEKEIQGYLCEVRKLSNLSMFNEGFLISTFNKDLIYNLLPTSKVSLGVLDEVVFNNLQTEEVEFETYDIQVRKAVDFCKENKGKVVLSRIKMQDLDSDFLLSSFFKNVCEKYMHSFNYCFHLENGQTWIGATPEVLIQAKNNNCRVYSLAGSRSTEDPFDWTNKEKVEQQLVTSRIAEQLDLLGIDYEYTDPRTIRAGNLEHLLTEFEFETDLVLEVADQLHPTPAVCGIPRDKALGFIRQTEEHDRQFYAGIIGWKKGGDISLYVNLRCAEITSRMIATHVGGGITSDSIPQKEWEETNIKSQTLLSVLKKN